MNWGDKPLKISRLFQNKIILNREEIIKTEGQPQDTRISYHIHRCPDYNTKMRLLEFINTLKKIKYHMTL